MKNFITFLFDSWVNFSVMYYIKEFNVTFYCFYTFIQYDFKQIYIKHIDVKIDFN